jgi:hypothetical protein
MRVLEAGEQKLVFERSFGAERLCCTFNLFAADAAFATSGRALISAGDVDGERLGPYSALIEAME